MGDFSPLLQQIRHFLNFLESILDEKNFKMNLLILEIYQMLLDTLKAKMKPNIRSVVSALLKHASDAKVVVRIENYKVLEKLMLAVKPNTVINHLLDHLGDKKAVVRESVLNMIMFGLLTFPSNEFDLKNIAATVVPTLVDPKRRVRHAALEAVSILAAFLGPTKVREDNHRPLKMTHGTILSHVRLCRSSAPSSCWRVILSAAAACWWPCRRGWRGGSWRALRARSV